MISVVFLSVGGLMRYFFAAFLLFGSVKCFADSALIAELSDNVGREFGKTFDMQRIEDVVKKENPDLFNYLKGRTAEEKNSFYKSWLAEKAYQSLFDKYMQELKQASKKLGRKIQKRMLNLKNGGRKTFYALDDKELKREYIPEFDIDVIHYPDDYEEFTITVTESDLLNKTRRGFTVVKDDKSKNESISIQVLLNSNVDFDNFNDVNVKYKSNLILGVTAHTTDYDKLTAYRKQTAADWKQGMMVPTTEPCYNEPNKMCKKWICNGDCNDWQSAKFYIGETYNFFQNHLIDYSVSDISDE